MFVMEEAPVWGPSQSQCNVTSILVRTGRRWLHSESAPRTLMQQASENNLGRSLVTLRAHSHLSTAVSSIVFCSRLSSSCSHLSWCSPSLELAFPIPPRETLRTRPPHPLLLLTRIQLDSVVLLLLLACATYHQLGLLFISSCLCAYVVSFLWSFPFTPELQFFHLSFSACRGIERLFSPTVWDRLIRAGPRCFS